MRARPLVGIILLIRVLITGCLGTYGRTRKQIGNGGEMTLAKLSETWEEYTVYYAHRSASPRRSAISALMFDPKGNDKTLVGDSWYEVEDHQTLTDAINIIQQYYYSARVEIIEGPRGDFFGYMYYSPRLHIPIKEVDPSTLYVFSPPPYKSTPAI